MKFTYPPEARPLEGYTIKRAIYRGGFGEVYFAVTDAGREVALKLLQNNAEVELRGVQQCLNLSHPNLVTIFDVKQDKDGDYWILMEYVPGETLDGAIRRFPQGMPVETVRKWLPGLAAGVSFLHSRGLVHRDLKPANIFIDNGVVKIGDVGLSKFIAPSQKSAQTQSVGTVYYMAPEIAKGRYGKEVDVYAAGIILFEMLTGQVPFDGESTGEILMKHLTSQPDLNKLPPRLQKVIGRALLKDPEQRYRSLDELKVAFDNAVLGRPDLEITGPGVAREEAARRFDATMPGDHRANTVRRQVPLEQMWPLFLFCLGLMFVLGFSGSPAIVTAGAGIGVAILGRRYLERRPWPNFASLNWHRPAIGAVAGFGLAMTHPIRDPDAPAVILILTAIGLAVGAYANRWKRGAMSSLAAAPVVCGAIGAEVVGLLLGHDLWRDRDDWVACVLAGMGAAGIGFIIALWQLQRKVPEPRITPQQRKLIQPVAFSTPVQHRASTLSSLALATPLSLGLTGVLIGFVPQLFQIGQKFDPSMIGMFATVALLGTWGVILESRVPTLRNGRARPTRWHYATMGLLLGLAAYGLSEFLFLTTTFPLDSRPPGWPRVFHEAMNGVIFKRFGDISLFHHLKGPTALGYIGFFTLLFLIRDWSHVVDPRRTRQLSIGRLLFTLACAGMVTRIVPFPWEWALAWTTVIGCASQLSLPPAPRQPRA